MTTKLTWSSDIEGDRGRSHTESDSCQRPNKEGKGGKEEREVRGRSRKKMTRKEEEEEEERGGARSAFFI